MAIEFGLMGQATVQLEDSVLHMFQSQVQGNESDNESGGQLFARFDSGKTIITIATPPRPTDRRWRYRFFPDRNAERREIAEYYKVGLHYVGDWHTHPQQVPQPSSNDIQSMQDCFRKSKHGLNSFLIIIVGTDPLPGGLYVALVNASQLFKLDQIDNLQFTCPK